MEMRKAEIINQDGTRTMKEFIEVKNGETFRLIDPDGTLVVNRKGQSVWTAASDAYYNQEGLLMVDVHRIMEE